MPTPCKPAAIIKAEGRSHRTKAELAVREAGEAALATGKPLTVRKEVKKDPKAYKEFKRVSELLEIIGKNDALIEGGINRYCQLTSEIFEMNEEKEKFSRGITQLQNAYEEDMNIHPAFDDRVIPTLDYFRTLSSMESSLLALDKRIMEKRKMLLDIEKENLMTLAAQLRSIPKKADSEEEDDPMAKLFSQNMKTRGA